VTTATTAVALMAAVMMAAAVTANAMAAVAGMVTAMAVVSQQRQWRQQQWRWGEIQQSTKKGMTETAIAKETVMVTDSDNNNVDADTSDIASMTATRKTHSGCALRWCSLSSLSSTPPPSSPPWLPSTMGSSPLSTATPGGATEITEEEYLQQHLVAPPTLAAAVAVAAVAAAAAAVVAAAAAAAIPNGERCDHRPHFPVWKHLRRNPLRRKKRQKSLFLFTATTFKKNKSRSDFQLIQIWNNCSQRQKKNYGRHPLPSSDFVVSFL
jgi:hypothetical protein